MSEFMEWMAGHSFIEVSVVMAVILLTQLLKWPIKSAAEKYEKRTGISKSRITWVISFLPLILCAVYAIIANGVQCVRLKPFSRFGIQINPQFYWGSRKRAELQ